MGKWRHRLTEINIKKRTGICSSCGLVFLTKGRGKYFRCGPAVRDHKRIYTQTQRRNSRHEPNPEVCQLCGNTKRVAYDHDHVTGKFRGWLCINCNTALGLVHDDIEHLRKLIAYLEKRVE